ncbi:MAG: transposase family protein [Methylococcales bacterium]|nr:transposase family protein [Methylococcales bacterium]
MKIKEILPRIYDDRQLRALTGLKTEHFILLLSLFEKTLIEDQKEKHENKERKYGSGLDSTLKTPADKLLFILNYMKCYSTFDHLGFSFNMNKSCAHTHVYKLFPILIKTLDIFNVLPATSFSTPEEMQQAFGGVQILIIDATERAVQRPSDYEEQNEFYSGKKNSIQLKIPL